MLAYLAIIKDSFREALASRVLWVLLIVIAVTLLALAPFGYREEQPTRLRGPFDLINGRELAETIRKQGMLGQPSPANRAWKTWDDATRKQVAQFAQGAEGQGSRRPEVLVEAMNRIIDGESVHSEADWREAWIGQEAKDLLARPWETLSIEERQRCNFLVLEAAFRDHFRPRPNNEIILTYAGLDLVPVAFAGRRLSKAQFQDLMLQRIVINLLIKILIGVVALFTAILVTSPIIPQMFAVGSLHLLLSKPVNRSLMFLAKFLGGCAFTLVNVTFLLVGLWLIAGLRFDVWNQGLLLCIPIFLFLFALYYSVSALAGVIWRSPVMCVVICVVFWLVCFTVEVVKSTMESQVAFNLRINGVIAVDEGFVARNEGGDFLIWDETASVWQSARPEGRASFVVGTPVYAAKPNRLAAILGPPPIPFAFSGGARFSAGRPEDGWSLESGPNLATGARRVLLASDGAILVFSDEGLHEFVGSLDLRDDTGGIIGQLQKYLPTRNREMKSVGPEQWRPTQPATAAVDPLQPLAVVYSAGEVLVLERAAGAARYRIQAHRTLPGGEEPADVASAGGRVLVARATGELLVLEGATLEPIHQAQPNGRGRPRYVKASPDGSTFAVAFHDGALWTSDVNNPQWRKADVVGQGDVSGVAFDDQGRMLVVDRWDRVTVYDKQGQVQQQLAPAPSFWQRAFRYVVSPLYAVFPKPKALDETVQYVLSKDDEFSLDGTEEQLEDRTRKLEPWRPVRDSFVFMIVMLAIACIYVQRQDF